MTEYPEKICPICGDESEDLDGFGVMHCEKCGYCTHPSSTGGICDLCGERAYTFNKD